MKQFKNDLLVNGLSQKTVKNIIVAHFGAIWRHARKCGGIELNPFELLEWQREPRKRPDPFTAEERDQIIGWYAKNDFFYYPLIAWQFFTAMRPSETFALTWRDINLEAGTVSINKSFNMGVTAAPKTANSDWIIPLDEGLVGILKLLPSLELGLEHVFVGKRGEPMSKKWAEHFWKAQIKKPVSSDTANSMQLGTLRLPS